MKENKIFSIFFAVSISFLGCQTKPSPSGPVELFPLDQVKLLDGPFLHATELNDSILLRYEPDRFLAKFRSEAGLVPRAENYHGWEDNTIAGHSLGHYLTACALMWKTTGEEEFLRRVNYIVDELEIVQQANKNGYIGAFPDGKRILEEEIAKGDIRPQSFDLNGIWVPYYTQHKVLAGLREAYRLCGNQKALQIASGFADWLETIVAHLNDEQVQHMLRCEHGGINEVLADLYSDTGEERYLKLSRIFHHKAVLDSLAHGVDILPGIHANTQIPKVIGLARRYEIVEDPNDGKAADFFWDRVVNHHSYVTGGNSNMEYFGKPDELRNRLGDGTTESCNVYNMLKLSSMLFTQEPDSRIGDYYERALYNHVLAAQHPGSGNVIYNLSLEMGGHKEYQNPYWFTCCVGTGMETHAKHGQNIYYHNEDAVYVNLFVHSAVSWEEKGVKIEQISRFPEEQESHFIVHCEKPVQFSLKIRDPHWAEKGLDFRLNSRHINPRKDPNGYFDIDRKWKEGDTLRLSFPFTLRLESMPDDSQRIAVFYGPVLLAADLGPAPERSVADSAKVPVLFASDRNPEHWLTKSGPLSFESNGVGHPADIKLRPFYQIHDRLYTVYMDMYSSQQWERHLKSLEEEKQALERLDNATLDLFQPGNPVSEKSHQLEGEDIYIERFKQREARVCNRGGWFTFTMGISPGTENELVVEYWGGYTGTRTFDILVEGQVIATENISGMKDGAFIYIHYPIPASLTKDRSKVHVRFQPHTGNRAGPVFSARTIPLSDQEI